MNLLKNLTLLMIVLVLTGACKKEDEEINLNNVKAPGEITAIFDITQDNTGLVTIVPSTEGVTYYRVSFGDDPNALPEEYDYNEPITHTYSEGIYTVGITAVGITGLTSSYEQEITVTFKAPENLEVTINIDDTNPRLVNVSATADYATVMDIYFGDVPNEEPVHALPGEVVAHTYEEPGDYLITVEAKSGGEATTVYSETITIEEGADPVNLPITFESFMVNYAFTDFGGVVSSVIDNPDASGINTSARVAQSLKTDGAETWGGSFLTLENPIDFSTNNVFKVKVWSPKAGAVVKLKVENLDNGDIGYEIDATTTTSNAWEELTYDFSGIDLNESYQKVVIFFDFGNPGDNSTYFFDDVKLVPGNIPSVTMIEDFEGTPPEFTVFGNIADIEIVSNPDQSGANTTATTAKMVKTEGSETWAGAFFEVDPGVLDLNSYNKIKMATWSPVSGIEVLLKLETSDPDIFHEVFVTNTTANAWEELVFDFSGAADEDYIKVVVFFDFGNPGDGTEYYFDEIELTNDGSSGDMTFEDFEGTPPEFTAFGNIADIEIVPNPDLSGENTTATVAKMTKTAGSETWAGAFFEVSPGTLDLSSYSNISVKTWSPVSGIDVLLKLETSDPDVFYEVTLANTTANAWENMTFDFSSAPLEEYIKVVIFFDFGSPGDDSVYYFDEFALTN